MKNLAYILIFLSALACKNTSEPEVKTAPTQEENVVEASTEDLNAVSVTSDYTLQSDQASLVFDAYLKLKGALVNTDASKTAEVAQDFLKMLATQPFEDFDKDKFKGSLAYIAATKDVSKQRENFEELSKVVESFLDGQVASGELYKQYCPMAFDGKGAYWLSDSPEIRNPYFGDKMLKCGTVDKRIN